MSQPRNDDEYLKSESAENGADSPAFWNLVDRFIELANDECGDDLTPGEVAAALTYAAARFNAFVVASSSLDRNAFKEDKDSAFEDLVRQYKHLLGGNLADYLDNYKLYMSEE